MSTSEETPTPVTVETQSVETQSVETQFAEAQSAEAEPQPAGTPPLPEHTWIEEIEIAGSQLVERLKELIAEGKVRRLIIRTAEDKVLVEIPLTAGVAVGGVVTFFAPVLAALGALAALLTRVKVQIVRAEE